MIHFIKELNLYFSFEDNKLHSYSKTHDNKVDFITKKEIEISSIDKRVFSVLSKYFDL